MDNRAEDGQQKPVKQIGIMSMHRICNHGSFLQAYALKKLLEQGGNRARFVDIALTNRPAPKKSPIASALHKLTYLDRYFWNRVRFRGAQKQMQDILNRVQREYLDLDEDFLTPDGCDAVVIGSDEIFNCESGGEFQISPQRFGDIPGVDRVITYAASCGYTGLDDATAADRRLIAQGLGKLYAVSVRDENTAQVVGHFRQGEVLRHLDPVLIYDFSRELESVSPDCLPKEPYMVVYAYHNRIHDKKEIKAIRAYAKKHGLKTIAVGSVQAWCDEFAALTPFEALAYFRGAACVVTDTFHGTIMSAIFHKNFGVMVRQSNANKLEDLLRRLELGNHKILNPDALAQTLDQTADYQMFDRILETERVRTREYLSSSLM